MGTRTQWYYKPTNNPRYPGAHQKEAFLTEYRTLGMPMSARRPIQNRSPEEYKAWLTRLSRHTTSSASKHEFPKLSFSYENRYLSWDGRYQWHKMDFLRDSKKVLWSRHGAIKYGYQLK